MSIDLTLIIMIVINSILIIKLQQRMTINILN
jgi:hypothetical protein